MKHEARYLAMRLARLIVTIIFEVAAFACVILIAGSLFFGLFAALDVLASGFAREEVLFASKLLGAAVLSAVLLAASVSVVAAAGLPYRYQDTMPGVYVYECRCCGSMTPDFSRCVRCNSPRPEYKGTVLFRWANSGVTWLWILHDCTIGLIAVI